MINEEHATLVGVRVVPTRWQGWIQSIFSISCRGWPRSSCVGSRSTGCICSFSWLLILSRFRIGRWVVPDMMSLHKASRFRDWRGRSRSTLACITRACWGGFGWLWCGWGPTAVGGGWSKGRSIPCGCFRNVIDVVNAAVLVEPLLPAGWQWGVIGGGWTCGRNAV